jgi:predicted O-methyltransferase YrrM
MRLLDAVRAAPRRAARRLTARLEARLAHVVRTEVDRAVLAVQDAEFRARRDLLAAGERDAARGSATYAAQVMPTARIFTDPHSTLRYALEIAQPGGMALEFGVFQGGSLRLIVAARSDGEVYGFDSFIGLPEDYRSHVREGAFAVDEPPVVPGAQLVVGWFDDTLPGFLDAHPGPVDFLHLDGDLYTSAKTVLTLVGPRLRAGSVIVFDEFFNFPGWEDHEFRAWQEHLAETGAEVTYEAYTVNNEQVAVRIVDPGRVRQG